MVIVIVIGLAIAALKYANAWIASFVYTMVFGLLLFSLAGIVVTRGNKQTFWVGFGVFGFGYLLHAFEFRNSSVPDLLFIRVIDVSVQVFNLTMYQAGDEDDTFLNLIAGDSSSSGRCQSQVFHCLIALLCGLFGTLVVRLFIAKEDARATAL